MIRKQFTSPGARLEPDAAPDNGARHFGHSFLPYLSSQEYAQVGQDLRTSLNSFTRAAEGKIGATTASSVKMQLLLNTITRSPPCSTNSDNDRDTILGDGKAKVLSKLTLRQVECVWP